VAVSTGIATAMYRLCHWLRAFVKNGAWWVCVKPFGASLGCSRLIVMCVLCRAPVSSVFSSNLDVPISPFLGAWFDTNEPGCDPVRLGSSQGSRLSLFDSHRLAQVMRRGACVLRRSALCVSLAVCSSVFILLSRDWALFRCEVSL